MRQIKIGGYKRISKQAAEKVYDNGGTVRLCCVNLNPVNPYGGYVDVVKDKYTEVSSDGFNTTVARNKKFSTVVQAFTYYNCVDSETGRYPAFYVKE